MASFYATTPIYYANSRPHLGHLYTTLLTDCVVRQRRQRGFETYFLTGTDEHGTNIQRAAGREGRTPKEQVDHVVAELKKMFAAFRLDSAHGGYDIFMRTTEPFHYEGVQNLWRRIAGRQTPKGREAIYKGFYEGWFCAPCATFKTEDEYLRPPAEGEAPLCTIHEAPLDRVSEESYFFRLSDYADALLELYETRPDFVRPEIRRNEVKSFVSAGLQDLSVSRLKTSVAWGIPVPEDPAHTVYVWLDALANYITAVGWGNDERERAVGFRKFWPAVHIIGKDILRQHAIYWPAFLLAAGIELPRAVVVHGIWLDKDGRKMSKTLGNAVDPFLLSRLFQADAVRYFLLREMAFGQDSRFNYAALVERANSDLASGLGNLAARTLTMIGRYCNGRIPQLSDPSLNRPDVLFLAEQRAGLSPSSSHVSYNQLFGQRVAQFERYCNEYSFSRALESIWEIIAACDKFISDYKPWDLWKDPAQHWRLNSVLYIAAETLRWLAVLLYPVMPEASRSLWQQLGLEGDPEAQNPSQLKWRGLVSGTRLGELTPLFPRLDKNKIMADIEKETSPQQEPSPRRQQETSPRQPSQTSSTQSPAGEAATAHRPADVPLAVRTADTQPLPKWQGATEADAVPGSPGADATRPRPPQRGATEGDPPVAAQPGAAQQGGASLAVQEGSAAQPGAATPAQAGATTPTQAGAGEGVTTLIGIEDFAKVELRVAEVLTAERLPKSDKLLRLTVDLGEAEPRQILAGIAEHYEPGPLVGRKIVVVANLKPRKMRGFESQGMLLAASVGDEGRPVLATFTEDVPNGARLK
jgi:methionyl-tRNA synthetase